MEGMERKLEELHRLSREGFSFCGGSFRASVKSPAQLPPRESVGGPKIQDGCENLAACPQREASARVISEIDFFGL